MTVGELQDILNDFDINMLVVMSIDSEGNGYNLCESYSECYYHEGPYEGDDSLETNAICLWPTKEVSKVDDDETIE